MVSTEIDSDIRIYGSSATDADVIFTQNINTVTGDEPLQYFITFAKSMV